MSPSTSLLSDWTFLPQPSSQVLPALAHQRGGSFLLCCLGLRSPALSVQTHFSPFIWVMSLPMTQGTL